MAAGAFRLEIPAFGEGLPIPRDFTADGRDVSPALAWSGAPEETRGFALICEDPDAPRGNWVHWVLYDVPPETAGLPEGVPPDDRPPGLGAHGRNDFGNPGYGGPAPPRGTHRYFFRLYALDRALGLAPGATAAELRRAMAGHVLAETSRMGTYSRG